MPKHKIEVSQPPKVVLNTDVRFSIYSDEALLGELKISKGTIDWRPAGRQKAVKRTWEWFAKMMER